MIEPTMTDFGVFISHSHYDSEFCLRLVNSLFQRIPTIDIFYDETTIRGGEMWMERISQEVLSRPIFIVVLSSRSVKADWVRAETYMALNEAITHRGKHWVIPIRLERCDVKELAPLLSYRQIIDFAGNPEGPGLDELVTAIQMTSQQPEQFIIEPGPDRRSSLHDEQEDARQLAANVDVYYKQGAYHHVTVIGTPAIQNKDNQADAELWAEVGHSFLEVGKRVGNKAESDEILKKALEVLGTASKINTKRPDIWCWLAETYNFLGDVDTAMKHWITALNWSDSPERILEIYAEVCSSLRDAKRDAELKSYVNAAMEILEVSSLSEDFKFSQRYWRQLYGAVGEEPAEKQDRAEAFKVLQEVIKDLGDSGQSRVFPRVVLGLQRRGIHHSRLGYKKFADFILDAEKQGMIRVVGPPEWGQVYLSSEQVTLKPVQKSKPSSSLKAPKLPSLSNESKVALILDRLEKSQTYITPEGVVEYFKKKYSHFAGAAKALLSKWAASGEIVAYVTQPLFLGESGQAETINAIQLNPESVHMQELIQSAYAASTSSWKALDLETQEYLISTLKLLTESLPYLTWNHFRTLLSKQDKDTDWDTAIATAIDSGVIVLALSNIEANDKHVLHTVKSLSLNSTNSEVTVAAAQAALPGSSQDSGWQRARQSFAKLFNIG